MTLSVASAETKSLQLFGTGQMSGGGTIGTVRHHAARGRLAPLSSRLLIASQHGDRNSDAVGNDASVDVKKSLFRRALLGFRYHVPAVEDEYVVFLYRSRNAPIAMCGVAGVLAIISVALDVGNLRAPFSYVTSAISAVWFAAGVTLFILKLQESALVTASRPDATSEGKSSQKDNNPIGSETDFSCGPEHVVNARRVEASMTVALVANMALCCSLFFAKANCDDSRNPQLAQKMCYDAIQIDGVINFMLILSLMLLRLRSILFASVLLLYLAVNIAIRFAPRAIPFAAQYFASSIIVISLQVLLCVAGASMLEFRSRKAFETLIRHHDKCSELEEVRVRNEALAPSKLPIEAIRRGAFERSDGIWEMAGSTRVYFACITLRNFLLFSCQLPPLQILDIVRAFNDGVDQAVARRRTVVGQQRRRPRTKVIDSNPLTPPLGTVPQDTRASQQNPATYNIIKFHSCGDMYLLSATPILHRRSKEERDGASGAAIRRDEEEFIRLIAECAGTAMSLLRPLIEESRAMTSRKMCSGGHLVCVSGASSGRGGGVVLQSSKTVLPIPMSSLSGAIQLCREAERVVSLDDSNLPVVRVPPDWVMMSSDGPSSITVASTWRDAECFKISVQIGTSDGIALPFSPLCRLTTANSDPVSENPFALDETVPESPRFEVEHPSRETELSNAVDLKRIIAWFPFMRRFSNIRTEALFAEDCSQQSPLLVVANMLLWSTALIVICAAVYNMGQLTSVANPLWWVLAALGLSSCFVFLVWLTPGDNRQSWVVATHVVCFLFTACVACAVFLATDDSVLGSGQLVWMYVLFGISSSRPIVVSPLLMWSLDGCTALAFLVNVVYNFPFEGEASDLKRYVTFASIAHFFYPLLFWLVLDDSSRQSFAVRHRTVLLQELLHDDHIQLKHAIDAMAIKGVAAELLGKSYRSKRVAHLMFHNDRMGRHAMRESNLRTSASDCAVVALRIPPPQDSIEACLRLQLVDQCLSTLNEDVTGCKRTVLMFGDTAAVFAMPVEDDDEIPSCVSLFSDTASAISSLTSLCSNMAAVFDYGPAVGGVFGSVPMAFEYFGSTMSRARLLLDAVADTNDAPQFVLTDRFYVMVSQSTAIERKTTLQAVGSTWKVRSLSAVGVRHFSLSRSPAL